MKKVLSCIAQLFEGSQKVALDTLAIVVERARCIGLDNCGAQNP